MSKAVPDLPPTRPHGAFAMAIEARRIEGSQVRLEPVESLHRELMRDLFASDPENWSMQTLSAVGDHFDNYWQLMTTEAKRITLAVIDKASDRLAGTSSFLAIEPRHQSVEIGYTFFHPDFRGTRVNPETKRLMLAQAFAAGARRVQFSVSAVNTRSRAAVLKLGARQEALLRDHRVTWQGARRDTVIFSILAEEWPGVEQGLIARLEP